MQRYQHDAGLGKIDSDPRQLAALRQLQRLHARLSAGEGTAGGWRRRLRRLFGRGRWLGLFGRGRGAAPAGVYLWGGVGRGKTYLMDILYDCLPFADKSRVHFHRFMQETHRGLRRHKNRAAPLRLVADEWARRARVICLDEFQVTDITDAMLLDGLLRALFAAGVCLVATSNVAPERLYWDGLQRERFLPAIAALKRHTRVVELGGDTDYRLRYLARAKTFHHPLDEAARAAMRQAFAAIAPHVAGDDGVGDSSLHGGKRGGPILEIERRRLRAVRLADSVAWFDFEELCGGPRGAVDYIEIARRFQTVLLSDVPLMDDDSADAARRFVTLVDEFYDRNVKLILSAAAAPSALYRGAALTDVFERAQSRLVEMQSQEYLARAHLL